MNLYSARQRATRSLVNPGYTSKPHRAKAITNALRKTKRILQLPVVDKAVHCHLESETPKELRSSPLDPSLASCREKGGPRPTRFRVVRTQIHRSFPRALPHRSVQEPQTLSLQFCSKQPLQSGQANPENLLRRRPQPLPTPPHAPVSPISFDPADEIVS